MDTQYGLEEIGILCDHFEAQLNLMEFNKSSALNEWKSFKHCVQKWYEKVKVESLWPIIFQYRAAEYPNVCKLATLVITMSCSNATVERSFSDLTNMLTDRRLSLNHGSMEMIS